MQRAWVTCSFACQLPRFFMARCYIARKKKCHLTSMEGKEEGCPLAHAVRYGDQKHMGATNLELPSVREEEQRVWTPLEISKDESFLAHNAATRRWPKFPN